MIRRETIDLLTRFAIGLIGSEEFSEQLDERLFQLRQTPRMTKERRLLSSAELYLHEIDEGLRDKFEIYYLVLGALDNMGAKSS